MDRIRKGAHRDQEGGPRSQRLDPQQHLDADLALARWLREARLDPTPERLWQLLQTRNYADLWYGAREAGELIRAQALRALYTSRNGPHGTHPDPREPAAFSSSAVLGAAARAMGLHVWAVPPELAAHADKLASPAQRPLRAWLVTYAERRAPDIAVRLPERDSAAEDARALHFQMACCLAYFAKEGERLTDPDAPAGITIPPADSLMLPLLHQFAKALLCLEDECPPGSGCPCNELRRRYNAPPADHPQPTDALDASALREEVQRRLHQQRPADSLPDPCECG